jgi:hypothetical protein
MARKKRPKAGTLHFTSVIKNSPNEPEQHREWDVTADDRRAQGRAEASIIARARLGIVYRAVVDIIGKEPDAGCAERLKTVNEALMLRGLKPYRSVKALAKAISRIRHGAAWL